MVHTCYYNVWCVVVFCWKQWHGFLCFAKTQMIVLNFWIIHILALRYTKSGCRVWNEFSIHRNPSNRYTRLFPSCGFVTSNVYFYYTDMSKMLHYFLLHFENLHISRNFFTKRCYIYFELWNKMLHKHLIFVAWACLKCYILFEWFR